MGVVYYSRYFEYFEAGRNEFLREIGYPYSKVESQNLILPVIEAYARYVAPAKYDDEVTLITMLREVPSVRVKLHYVLRGNHKDVLAEGYTIHSFANALTKKPARPPADFVELIKSLMK